MLRVKNLRKTYAMAEGRVEAVRGVSFDVDPGVFLTLLGPSGCGKTTTLRCVAGLETPDSGEIYVGEQAVFVGNRGVLVPAYRRGVGMVFQSYAIWPHMTVAENVSFPLVHGGFKVPKSKVNEKVRKALELVGLGALENRPAPLLSGGQQQRVSLARALVYEPKLLLLDEPLSNLDAKLREEMRLELREIVRRLKISTLYVTHDQEEALVLSDHIAVMSEGQILQQGSPRDIYLNPQHPFVANFVGSANFIDGAIDEAKNGHYGFAVGTALGPISCPLPSDVKIGERVSVVFRPEDVLIHIDAERSRTNMFPGVLERVIFVGKRTHCEIRSGSLLLHSEASARTEMQQGSRVVVEIPPEYVRILRSQ
ncbi:MAG: ABC transporter ATP-binding protein [Deltaproteobacteria bacterium]|nr:ABC transporter ATP-binding protein [Deltaproteobacteria bacterium]